MSKHEKESQKYLVLKQDLTRALAELDVSSKKNEDLKGLLQVSALLNVTIDSHRLLETIVGQAKSVINAQAAALLRFDPKKNQLSYEAIVTDKGIDSNPKLQIPQGKGVASWVAEHKIPIYVPDLKKDSRFEQISNKDLGLEIHSVLAVPLQSRDKLLGVLEAVNPSLKRFVADEALELFTFFANQAASAISNAKLFADFKQLFLSTVRSLSQALEAKDEYTSGHAQRVSLFAIVIAKEMGLNPIDVESVELSALLHDIGKIGVPEGILTKPAKITDEEYEEIKKHPIHGFKILEPLEHLGKVLPGIKHHHERWDGEGYPDRLKGEDIPLSARIVCVVDAFDAMTSTRPYRKALPDEEALRRLKKDSGTQFDPQVTEALFRAYDKGLLITTNQKSNAA